VRMHWYLGRQFLLIFLGLEASLVMTAILFEGVTSKSVAGWSIGLFKMPFLVHRTLPFVIFISALFLMWRLIRFHEWEIFSSAGASLGKIFMAPLVMTSALSIVDLLILMPMSQTLLNPQAFKEKEGRISVGSPGWFAQEKPLSYVLWFWDGDHLKELFFRKDSLFQKQIMGQGTSKTQEKITLRSGWIIQSDGELTSLKEYPISVPSQDKGEVSHPSMMSFLDTSKATPHNPQQARAVMFRQGYLLANALWIVTLIPLAVSVMIGPAKRRRIRQGLGGLGLCFGIYLIKEWLYALSMPMSYLLQPIISWIVPAVTLLLSVVILFEKNEL